MSPLDHSGSSKEGVSYTYTGKQHCQSGTTAFIARSVETLQTLGLGGKCLLRLDSGNAAADNFDAFGDHYFIVKRNPRRECPEQTLALARRVGDKQDSREGKNVYTGFFDHFHPGGDQNRPCVPVAFEVIERTIDIDGQKLLVPKLEVSTWWTNLSCRAKTVLDLYHRHGPSEQYHSELKSDLDVERLPSGRLCANKIILLCAMVAFNLLRGLGQEVIKRAGLAPQKINIPRWRIKTVLKNIIYCAVRLVRHAGRIELHFGKRCRWFEVIQDIAHSFA